MVPTTVTESLGLVHGPVYQGNLLKGKDDPAAQTPLGGKAWIC